MYKMIGIDNPGSAGAALLNQEHDFNFHGVAFYFGTIQSSRVNSIVIEDNTMIVQTKNTKYTFRRV